MCTAAVHLGLQFYNIEGSKFRLFAVAIWPVTGQGFQNTKWTAVLYSQ